MRDVKKNLKVTERVKNSVLIGVLTLNLETRKSVKILTALAVEKIFRQNLKYSAIAAVDAGLTQG